MFQTTTRNANLLDLMNALKEQQVRKHDIVAPARHIRSKDGLIVVKGSEAILSEDGVSTADGSYLPTEVMDEGLSSKLGIQLSYMRRMRAERPDILDANVNGWLHGKGRFVEGSHQVIHPADDRAFLLRLFRGDDGGVGIGRALLSSKFARIENLDIVLSVLEAIKATDVDAQVVGGDLSDRRMYLRISAPSVQALAPQLLKDYRSPFSGNRGADNPVVFAGFEVSNSEVGNGAFSITPRITFEVCSNGMKLTKDALRSVHLGSRLEEGVINWTADTERKALDLIMAKTRDAVTTFLDVDYMEKVIAGMTEVAEVKITDPAETITTLSKKLAFDDDTAAGILNHFIQGADISAGGVMHAVTSWAQTVGDADAASDLESVAFKAMELAAAGQ